MTRVRKPCRRREALAIILDALALAAWLGALYAGFVIAGAAS